MNAPTLAIQFISTFGAMCCLVAYVGHQLHWMSGSKVTYNLLNLVGSGILCYIAFSPFQAGFWVMETVWGLVSLFALIRGLTKREVK